MVAEYEETPPDWILSELPRTAIGWEPDDPSGGKEWFLGPNYGAYAERMLKVGGFDLNMGPGTGSHLGDEMDMQRRLFEDGCQKAYLPGAKVWHYVPINRCSPAFALSRRFMEGVLDGIREQDQALGTGHRQTPKWLTRRLISTGLVAALSHMAPSARQRYLGKKQYYRWKGYRQGLYHEQRAA